MDFKQSNILFGEALAKNDFVNAEKYLDIMNDYLSHQSIKKVTWGQYLCNKAALLCNKGEFLECIKVCNQYNNVSQNHENLKLLGKINYIISGAYSNLGEIDNSYKYIDNAIKYTKRTNSKEDLSGELITKSDLLLSKGNWKEAIKYVSEALLISKQNNYIKTQAKAYYKLGFIFRAHRFLYLAIDHFRYAEKIYTELNYEHYIQICIYERANTWLCIRDYEQCSKLIDKLENIIDNNSLNVVYIKKLKYCLYNAKEDFNNALMLAKEINEFYTRYNDKTGISESLELIGSVYYNMRDFEKSIEYGNKSLEISKQTGHKIRQDLSTNLIRSSLVFDQINWDEDDSRRN